MTDTTTTDPSAPPAGDAPPPRPGRKVHPVAATVWAGLGLVLAATIVLAATHHSPAASKTARRAVHQAPVASAPAPAATTTTTTVPIGTPLPYVRDGQPVATRAEVTVGGGDFAVTSAHTGHATRTPDNFGSLGLGAEISPSSLPPLSGSGEVWVLTGTLGTTMAVGVPPAVCGVVWTAGSAGSPAHNVGLAPTDPVIDVVWGLPAPIPSTPTIAAPSESIRLMFATSCTPAAAGGTYAATRGDDWGFP